LTFGTLDGLRLEYIDKDGKQQCCSTHFLSRLAEQGMPICW
jgi:hypothetical protein